jgi:hypothetical protein
MGLHMPNRPDAATGIPKGRVAPVHGLEARFDIGESGGRGTTSSRPATCGIPDPHAKAAFPLHKHLDVKFTPLDRQRPCRSGFEDRSPEPPSNRGTGTTAGAWRWT